MEEYAANHRRRHPYSISSSSFMKLRLQHLRDSPDANRTESVQPVARRSPKKVWGEQRLGIILNFVRYVAQGGMYHRRREVVKNLVFTIGHSNHSAEKFVYLLKGYAIEVVVDTRSHPYSRHAQRFNANALESALSRDGIGYLFLGGELGGRPEGGEFYDAKGRVDYALVGCSRPFLDGISRLEKELRAHTTALLCSEEDPARCHRRLLVGLALKERGVTLRHIRGDGSVETEGEADGGQPVLFPETEASPRKSIRSVSRKRRRPSSSGR